MQLHVKLEFTNFPIIYTKHILILRSINSATKQYQAIACKIEIYSLFNHLY